MRFFFSFLFFYGSKNFLVLSGGARDLCIDNNFFFSSSLLPGFLEGKFDFEFMGCYAGCGLATVDLAAMVYSMNTKDDHGVTYICLSALLVDAIIATHCKKFYSVIATTLPSNITVLTGILVRFENYYFEIGTNFNFFFIFSEN